MNGLASDVVMIMVTVFVYDAVIFASCCAMIVVAKIKNNAFSLLGWVVASLLACRILVHTALWILR